jgi:hypothetical protein
MRGTGLMVEVYDDRVEIVNPGGCAMACPDGRDIYDNRMYRFFIAGFHFLFLVVTRIIKAFT